MEEKFDQIKYIQQYNKENYHRFSVYILKDKRWILKALADKEKISVSELFRRAVSEKYHVDL